MDLAEIWAKSPAKGELRGETLAAHTARVLEGLVGLRERVPQLAELCRMPRFWTRAALAAATHDLGKCCVGFQEQLRGKGKFGYRHEVFSLSFLSWLLAEDDSGDRPWVCACVVTHHKDIDIVREYRSDTGVIRHMTPEFLRSGSRVLRDAIWPELLRSGFKIPTKWTAAVQQGWTPKSAYDLLEKALDDIEGLEYRLKSKNASDPEAIAARFLRGVLIIADHAGSAHETLRRLPELKCAKEMLVRFPGLPPIEELFAHQRAAASTDCSAILVAPTGSGKTESALLWAASCGTRKEGNPVLFYVLPYQASMNAMKRRLESAFGPDNVSLQHSRALQAVYRMALDKEYTPDRAAQNARRERNLARLHATPVRVLSPYQLLRAAFQLKGHDAIWTDAAGALFVWDEIHAYEPARLGMMLATLRHLRADLGVHALVMSATMPQVVRAVVSEALGEYVSIEADAATLERFRRHEVQIVPGDLLDAATEKVIREQYRSGESVLVVTNTVSRAQQLWQRMRQDGAELLHGRFHAEDRSEKEARLLERQGVGMNRSTPALLVATQVVEVSLNIDFDTLYSDPAPLEALLQRFGRVNRKSQRERPSPKAVRVMSGIPEGCPVYERNSVEKALESLRQWDRKVLAEDQVQTMLNCVYDGDTGERWLREVRQAARRFQRDVLETCRPLHSVDWIRERFDELFDGFEVLPASLEKQYRERLEGKDAMLAPAFLVPVTRGQYWRLQKHGRVQWKDDVLVADCAYDGRLGLQLDTTAEEDGV